MSKIMTFSNNQHLKHAVMVFLVIILLSACTNSSSEAPGSTIPSIPTQTSTSFPTNTIVPPTETATLVPTPTEIVYSWESTAFDEGAVSSLAIDPSASSNIYMTMWGGSSKGFYFSNDGGITLERVLNKDLYTVLIDSSDPSILYTGGFGAGIFKSTDSGKSWTLLVNKISSSSYTVFSLYSQQLTSGVIYAATSGGIFTSKDQGNTWELMGLSEKKVAALAFDPVDSAVLYAIARREGLFKTSDGGQNWAQVWYKDEKTDITTILADPNTPGTLYMGIKELKDPMSFGLYKSIDGGLNWKDINPVPDMPMPIYTLLWDGSQANILYCGTGDGFYKSSDNGESWVFFGPEHYKNIYAIALTSGNPPKFYLGSQAAFYISK